MSFFVKKSPVRFTIKLGDIPIEVNAVYRKTRSFCRDYITNESPEISVFISKEDIRKERKLSILQAKSERRLSIGYFSWYLERLALCRKVAEKLLNYNIILFHGAVMAIDNKAYLFTAKSGTGKTTHCKLWLKNIPDCHILNGDKPLLLFKDEKIYACSSPWQGKENYGTNEILPLESICLLEQSKINHIEKIKLRENFEFVFNQCNIPNVEGTLPKVMALIKQFSNIRLYRLSCNMDDQAAKLSFRSLVINK